MVTTTQAREHEFVTGPEADIAIDFSPSQCTTLDEPTAPDNVCTLSDAFVLGRDGCQPLKSADLPQPKVDGASDAFDNDHRRAVSITCLVQSTHQPLPPAGYGASRTPRTSYDAR